MEFNDATNAATRVLRRRPTTVVPAFLAESALAILVQLTLVAAAGLSLVALRGTAELDRATAAFRDLGQTPTEAEFEAFIEAVGNLFTPTVVGIIAGSVLVALALALLVRAAAGAAKVHTAWAAMTDGDPTTAAVAGTVADTWAFLRLTLLQLLLLFGLPVGAVLLGATVGGSGGTTLALLAVLSWIPLALLTYFLLLFVPEAIVVEGVGVRGGIRRNLSVLRANPGRALLFGVLELAMYFVAGGIGGALGFAGVGRLSGLVTLFLVLPFLGLVKMGLYVDPERHPEVPEATPDRRRLAGDREPTGDRPDTDRDRSGDRFGGTGPSAGDAGYEPGDRDRPRDARGRRGTDRDDRDGDGRRGDPRGREPPPSEERGRGDPPGERPPRERREPMRIPRPGPLADPTEPVRGRSYGEDLKAVFAAGLAELRSFATERVGLVAVSLVAFLLGAAGGYQLTVSTGVDLVSKVPTGAGFGVFPVDTAINLASNNWQVAIGQTYAALLFGLPALGNLAFNGAIVGGFAGLGFDPVVFLALVVPHGVIEVTALAVSGALGLHLGGRGIALARGRIDAATAGDELERGFLVLLGLLPVFAVAGLIEAFLTPVVADVVAGAL